LAPALPPWFNAPPAAVFMGVRQVWHSAAALGAIAVSIHHEIVLAIVGGLFGARGLSVIVRCFSSSAPAARVSHGPDSSSLLKQLWCRIHQL